jgi:hypothetical protein
VQPILVAEIGVAVALRHQATGAVALDEILEDRARLGDGAAIIGDDWRLAERVHGAQ